MLLSIAVCEIYKRCGTVVNENSMVVLEGADEQGKRLLKSVEARNFERMTLEKNFYKCFKQNIASTKHGS